jgi:hypothetical protein
VKWTNRLYEIRERVVHSKRETWDRHAIEDLFDVRRVTAQNLMRAIGELSNIGGAHLTSRSSLLEFLDFVMQADDMDQAVRVRMDTAAAAPPQKKGLLLPVPEDLRSVRLAELPPNIEIAPGLLSIKGASAFEILSALAVLARALENDLDSFVAAWNPAPRPSPARQSDPDTNMWTALKEMERAHAESMAEAGSAQ